MNEMETIQRLDLEFGAVELGVNGVNDDEEYESFSVRLALTRDHIGGGMNQAGQNRVSLLLYEHEVRILAKAFKDIVKKLDADD